VGYVTGPGAGSPVIRVGPRAAGRGHDPAESGIEVASELLAEDLVDHNPYPGQAPGLDGHNQAVAMIRRAFPDLRFTADVVVSDGAVRNRALDHDRDKHRPVRPVRAADQAVARLTARS
jgi:hypothetical protein